AETTAVLPFVNASPASVPNSANLDWIGESIAETLNETLGAKGLLTLERDNVREAYRRLQLRERAGLTHASGFKLGGTLDAEEMIHGSFAFLPAPAGSTSKGSLKIQTRIFDRRRLRESPEFNETGALEDLATIEAHLAWRALTVLAPEKAPSEAEFRSLR